MKLSILSKPEPAKTGKTHRPPVKQTKSNHGKKRNHRVTSPETVSREDVRSSQKAAAALVMSNPFFWIPAPCRTDRFRRCVGSRSIKIFYILHIPNAPSLQTKIFISIWRTYGKFVCLNMNLHRKIGMESSFENLCVLSLCFVMVQALQHLFYAPNNS